MIETQPDGPDDEFEQDVEYYLPGMPVLSTGTGPLERFLTRLFRRRGGLRVVVRRE